MGFDNECILNIQSLAGEYFCPVCRLLVYPNEAIQSQCTHLYCKPCLTYVVGTTKACPYDGYLVTEADSKPLVESNKTLAETIGKIAVHCLYHRSGCTWQGELSECVNHCAECAFGNSPVVCNRCGTQIVHRQVQEHAQNCPGVQPQAQQADSSQVTTTAPAVTATSGQNQTTIQAGVPASQAQVAQIAVAPTSGQDQSQANTNSQPQGAVQVVPTPEQLYQQQQQYQQYYQQYPGYDPYQQQYQQYASYQQQAYPQYQQQGSMPQAQMYMQPQPQPQSQTQLPVQPQAQVQVQAQVQAQAQSQSHSQGQQPPQAQTQTQPPVHAQPQAQVGVQPQVQPQGNVPNQIQPSHPHPQMQPQPPQLYSQAPSHQQSHPPHLQLQPHIQQLPQVAQHQQTLPQPQQQMHPYPPQQSVAQSQIHPQSQVQPHTHVQVQQPQMQPQTRPPIQPQMQPQHPSSHAVTGHQSYPQPANQQMPPVASQLQSIHMQPQQQGAPRQLPQQTQVPLPQQQLAQMRPPQSHVPMQQQQQQAMVPPQSQLPNVPPVQQPAHNYPHQPNHPIQQYTGTQLPLQQNMSQQQVHGHALHSQAFPGQTPGFVQNTPQQPAPFTQHQLMQPHLHSAVPPLPLPSASHAQQQSQQNVSLPHGFQSQGSQTYGGRPMLQNHGVPRQPFQPSLVGPAGPTHAKMQSTGVQQFPPRPNTRPHSSAEQHGGYMHRPGVPQSSHAAPVSSSPAPMSATKTQFSSEHLIMKPKLQDEAASQTTGLNEANALPITPSQGSRLNESNGKPENEPRPELELKSMGSDDNSVNECEITGSHSKSAGNESLESSQALKKSPVSFTLEGLDEPVVKNTVKEETMSKPESSSVGILAETAVQNKEVIPRITQKPDGDSLPEDKEDLDDGGNHSCQQAGVFDGKNGKVLNDSTESHGNVALRVKSHKNEPNGDALSSQEKNMLQHQSSYQDRFHQVPPISDQMSIQNRHPHQIQVRPPAHMRPHGNNILGNVPLQVHPLSAPPHFQQSMANQPRGMLQSEVYRGGIAGAASFGGGPGPLGPQGHLNTGQMVSLHAGAPRMQGDSVGRPAFGGPPPGAFDCQPVTAGRLHPPGQQILSAPMDSGINANKMSGYYDGRQPDFHMPGTADRVSFSQPSNMQSDVMKMNGGSSRRLSGGPSDPSYPFGLQEERFKHFPEERYRQLPEGFNLPGEERRSGFPVEPSRHTVNPREFFDDLKKFPRPTHLDAEHVPKSENYSSSSRPLDRTPQGFISDARLNLGSSASASRLPLPSQASGPRPFNVRDDIAGRKMDHFGIHPDFHRSVPESGRLHMDGFPPFRSPGREYPDIPPTRFGRIEDNDGRESHDFGERPKPFNLHSDVNPFPERRFPGFSNHLRKEEFNIPGNLRIGERIRPMGEDLFGPDNLPMHLRSGGPVGPRNLQMGEPGGYGSLPNALRLGDVGGPGNMPIGGNIPSHSRPGFSRGMPIHGYGSDAGFFDSGEIESLDNTRKRKHGSNGWCRICKVDCETVEGLELHSQTREHQKMAMDMVLIIKKDNAKKHKISSDDHIAHEGNTNKIRKANVENHGN